MTGARLSVTIDDDGLVTGLRQLAALGAAPGPLMRAIGAGLVETTQARFDHATDPDGHAWRPLNAAYAAAKRGPGILR